MMEMLNFIYTDIVNFFLPSMKWSIVLASTCTVLTSFSVAQFLLWIKGNRLPRHGKLPPGPPSWGPLVGNLPQFRTSMRTPHVRAQELAKTYGPVMRVQMGGKVLIFISDPKIADRCFKDNDHNFANRPSIAAQKYLLYGGDHPCKNSVTLTVELHLQNILTKSLKNLLHSSRWQFSGSNHCELWFINLELDNRLPFNWGTVCRTFDEEIHSQIKWINVLKFLFSEILASLQLMIFLENCCHLVESTLRFRRNSRW